MIKHTHACTPLSIALSSLLVLSASASAQGPGQPQLPPPATDADFYDNGAPPEPKVRLGRLLFFDKILSGNRNISCATCHHPLTDTGDGLSLPSGEGARGLGVTRDTGTDADAIHERVPRNAPHVFNLGAREFTRMFFDGRVELDPGQPSGFRSPVGDDLPLDLDNPLAVQAMFPVTSPAEMAGQSGENSIANAAVAGNLAGPGGVWEQLADRLRANPLYLGLFRSAYPGVVQGPGDITFAQAANAIAAFEAVAWRADDSPFDRFLRGDRQAMSREARRGMQLFYGAAGCATCHTGTFQTDQEFHAAGMPQIGPGKGDGPSGREDFGRERVTQDPADRFRFRTPTLRNVALTGPWGHDGAYNSLEAVVRHQTSPVVGLDAYDPGQRVLPHRPDLDAIDLQVHEDLALRANVAAACELQPVTLTDLEVRRLVKFLHALTDARSLDLRRDIPDRVPSGLRMYD